MVPLIFHFQRNNNATTSWNMGEEINFVELDHPITQESLCMVIVNGHLVTLTLNHKLKGRNGSSRR